MSIVITLYRSQCFILFTFSLAYLLIGITLYQNQASDYAQSIFYETQLWNKGPIVDIISSQILPCPTGYDHLKLKFYGTENICSKSGSYHTGVCIGSESGFTKDGLPEVTMNKFNKQYICVRRDNNLNYHQMVQRRNSKCETGTMCGSTNDSDKGFCQSKGQTCPLNNLSLVAQSNISNNDSIKTFSNQTKVLLQRDNQFNNPIAEIYISLSKPCGIQSQHYVRRNITIKPIYKDITVECTYNNKGQEHQLFQKVGYSQAELDIYQDNGVLQEIQKHVPDFTDTELKLNSYHLYFRPYSHYMATCQQQFTTTDVSTFGIRISSVSKYIEFIFYISVINFGIQLIQQTTQLILQECLEKKKKMKININNLLYIIVGIIELLWNFCLFAMYCLEIGSIQTMNPKLVQYLGQNTCSDAVLQYSFQKYSTYLEYISLLSGLGMLFIILQIILKIVSYKFLYGLPKGRQIRFCKRLENYLNRESFEDIEVIKKIQEQRFKVTTVEVKLNKRKQFLENTSQKSKKSNIDVIPEVNEQYEVVIDQSTLREQSLLSKRNLETLQKEALKKQIVNTKKLSALKLDQLNKKDSQQPTQDFLVDRFESMQRHSVLISSEFNPVNYNYSSRSKIDDTDQQK